MKNIFQKYFTQIIFGKIFLENIFVKIIRKNPCIYEAHVIAVDPHHPYIIALYIRDFDVVELYITSLYVAYMANKRYAATCCLHKRKTDSVLMTNRLSFLLKLVSKRCGGTRTLISYRMLSRAILN